MVRGGGGGFEVEQWRGEMVELDRNCGQGLDLERRQCRRVAVQGPWGWGCTVDENEICFWNMHGQWNKTKAEGERVRQEIIQKG